MQELLEAYPWLPYVPTIFLILLVIGHRIFSRFGNFKVRCPNCKAYNTYTVESELQKSGLFGPVTISSLDR